MTTLITAKLKYLRVGPRKVRLVANLIRGRAVLKAADILSLSGKRAARPLLKLLLSAIASAKHDYKLAPDDLRVASLTVDGGPSLKRWMPRAHGRASPIRERTSHINLILKAQKKAQKAEKASLSSISKYES